VSPDGSRVYVANSGSGTLSVVSTVTDSVTSTIAVGPNPFGVAASPDGQRVYVANSGDASVSVINAATLTVASTIRVGGHAMGVAVSDDSARVVVSNPFDNSISVINAATQTVVATTTAGIGLAPAGVSFTPGGTTALVANSRAGTVSAVNAISGTAAALAASSLGSPLSLGKFVATTPRCALDVSADASVSAGSDGLLILRHMLGFRGVALTQGIGGIGAGVNATMIEQSIAALNLDADGDTALNPTTDGLLLVRALLSLTDAALIANARNSASPSVRNAAQVLQWITSTHGASCLI
jgi:YVTN family beta-propeller protein